MNNKFLKAALVSLILSTSSLFNVANATLINVALDGVASQSSTDFGGSASRAIDDNTSGLWSDRSVTHTATSENPFWIVDLGEEFLIDSVVIWNRTDSCCTTRLNNAIIELFDSAMVLVGGIGIGTLASPDATIGGGGLTGQFVRVRLEGQSKILSLAEVQVFSEVPEPAALALLGLGLVGLGLSRRKKAIC
jgi:hypothetical protein